MDFISIIKKVKPSVAFIVVINATGVATGTGSGFVYLKNNILVTCNHVIKDANSLLLKFPDTDKFIPAKTVVRDEEHDLALLKFDDQSRVPLESTNIKNIEEGMPVVFSGFPFSSTDITTHQGIISAIIKDATGLTSYTIDGTVNPGNSGCPLLDSEGKVIGIVNATRRERNDVLEKVLNMPSGTLTLHGLDLVEIYKVLTSNVQLGVGYAVPASYIPEYKELLETTEIDNKKKGHVKKS